MSREIAQHVLRPRIATFVLRTRPAKSIQARGFGIVPPLPIVGGNGCRRRLGTSSLRRQGQSFVATSSPPAIAAENDALPPLLQSIDLSSIIACPGCGALAQSIEAGQPGFYSSRPVVRKFVQSQRPQQDIRTRENAQDGSSRLEVHPVNTHAQQHAQQQAPETPVCDRCHDLMHHNVRTPVPNPSIDAIYDTIEQSPWKYNHIIHVLDAADFPLSAIKNIHDLLDASPQRSRNRRAKTHRYTRDRRMDLSFVITRSDLLAPEKEMIDRLMPKLTRILKEHLGFAGQDKRFGNVHCVSATRGYWTTKVKGIVKDTRGAVWLVGKENVGKSRLFEVIFPKGSIESLAEARRERSIMENRRHQGSPMIASAETEISFENASVLDPGSSLLPPARKEVPYPIMPIASDMPGTTASPIRIPFGQGSGELIDLPGLERGHMAGLVQDDHRATLLMKKRVSKPTRHILRPGQSLLLGGGLVRITPVNDYEAITMITPFVTVDQHVTSNDKAVAIQRGSDEINVLNILTKEARQSVESAGVFQIAQDVTLQRAGPLTAKKGIGLKLDRLPFRVFAVDIVIEGLGWLDISVQVRSKDFPREGSPAPQDDLPFPAIEVFAPGGKFVAARETLNAGQYMGPRKSSSDARPRRSMSRAKTNNRSRATGAVDLG